MTCDVTRFGKATVAEILSRKPESLNGLKSVKDRTIQRKRSVTLPLLLTGKKAFLTTNAHMHIAHVAPSCPAQKVPRSSKPEGNIPHAQRSYMYIHRHARNART
jgi:hypothetical protein